MMQHPAPWLALAPWGIALPLPPHHHHGLLPPPPPLPHPAFIHIPAPHTHPRQVGLLLDKPSSLETST
ncbi:hypothetical protein GE061_010390 [Apolygus lucorum]|uniref:Uncharacterized protein n=1 Tax=Apolygus lucorum TaxID=248454 RepID=A0A8S9Y473_APOLU|nr:hypothetical protein GE061_010390 [Apolygus lucorum]